MVHAPPDAIAARKWEISENLHRADLTKLERDEQAAEWIRLTEVQASEQRLAQVVTATLSDGRRAPPQNLESGIRSAARELGLSKSKALRAVKVASLPEPVKQAARDLGLDACRHPRLNDQW